MNFGSELRTFFLRPLLATAVAGEAPAAGPRRSQAHRAMAVRPTTDMRAQRRAARMTTKSDSNEAVESGGGAAEEMDCNVLSERVMLKWKKKS